MPTVVEETSDFEKLANVFSTLTSSFGSVDGLLGAFGLKDLPTAQRYGILFGCIVFTCTISAVLALLIFGGSFQRMEEQAKTGKATLPAPVEARADRPLLLERLLLARERMLHAHKKANTSKEKYTTLERILMNDEPKGISLSDLVDENDNKKEKESTEYASEFERNYLTAYRTCQDKPGGKMLSGQPEARFEAYARAYAGCGSWPATSYRRSYARLYERMACATHSTEAKYTSHYNERPQDIIGRTVRLEPLEASRHVQTFFDITCGLAHQGNKSFHPNEVWAFLDCGPIESPKEMEESFLFQRATDHEAAFAIVEMITDRLIGIARLTQNDPQNLSIQLEPPIVKPSSRGTAEEMEACFLLLDRIFALGYRRVQLALDTQDASSKKLPGRLGFTQEGLILKHRIVKESNSDSLVYGMLNSDWDKGARTVLYKKLHGSKWTKMDQINNQKEGELEEQQRVLKERRRLEEEEGKENKRP